MNFEIGFILGHLCEYIMFLYFADTSFYSRNSKSQSVIIALCGYIILFLVGLLQNAILSITIFFVVNLILLRFCYNLKLKNAVFYSIVLDVLSVIGEYLILYLVGVRYAVTWIKPDSISYVAVIIGSKLIYLIGIIIVKRFTIKSNTDENESQILLTVIPILTVICLTMMMSINMNYLMFVLFCITFMLVNFVALYVNARLVAKNKKIRVLNEEYNKSKAELIEYQLLSEKYESTKTMRHDLHKQLSVLNDLIAIDNVQAKEYAKQIDFAQKELGYVEYTDSKILNTLLDRKIKECHNCGIEIFIHSKSSSVMFISDIDIVTIFSNLIDNAIEACEYSEEKEIYINLYNVNTTFVAIKVENSSDKEPVVLNGLLRTQKENSEMHGIGIKSINNVLKKYNSSLDWSYDKENKIFKTIALIHIPQSI